MNPEIAQLKGELAEAKHRHAEFDIEAKGLILQIRLLINPHEEDVTKLKTEQAFVSMKRLHQIKTEMGILKSKIDKISENFQ